MVGEGVGELHGFGEDTGGAGEEPGLGADGDLGAVGGGGAIDAVGGEAEPLLFGFDIADELRVGFAAGVHEAGADGGDGDVFLAELDMQAFAEADYM